MFNKQIFIIFTALILSCGCLIAQAESSGIKSSTQFSQVTVNKPAPLFTLLDTKNNLVSLSDFKGKYVVLEWFNFECPFVKKHYESGNMQKLQKEYTDKGVIWLSICSSAPGKPGNESASQFDKIFAEKKAAPTAVLLDTKGKVGHLYDAKTTPTMYVVNPEGILVYTGAIDDTPGTDISEIATAKNYVKAALDETMAGQAVTTAETKSYGCSVKYAQ